MVQPVPVSGDRVAGGGVCVVPSWTWSVHGRRPKLS